MLYYFTFLQEILTKCIFFNINLKDAGTKGDLGKDGMSEDRTGFSLIREVKMMMMMMYIFFKDLLTQNFRIIH
jgi:hypothetical protein